MKFFSVSISWLEEEEFKGHATVPGPLSCYAEGSKRVKEGGGCGRKLLKCEKDTEGCVWVCVLGAGGVWPSA